MHLAEEDEDAVSLKTQTSSQTEMKLLLESLLSIIARLFEVTSYSHPPANEQVRPLVLDEMLNAFVKFELV